MFVVEAAAFPPTPLSKFLMVMKGKKGGNENYFEIRYQSLKLNCQDHLVCFFEAVIKEFQVTKIAVETR